MRAFSKHSRRARAFSLVEVVLALGVSSFVLLTLVGTLPAGVKSVQNSMSESAQASITQQLRAELQQISFSTNSTAAYNISNLANDTNYYSNDGTAMTNSTGAYYQATFLVNTASIPGSATTFQASNARSIGVVLSYPLTAPVANQTTNVFYLFAAMQKSN
jgi:uncharacterized protein (TIGR02598 family)